MLTHSLCAFQLVERRYLAGTLAGLQLPGVIILVAKLLAGS